MTWRLEVYDTEMREARSRRYTRSAKVAARWTRIPRIDFSDSAHGLVFRADEHTGKRLPELSPWAYEDREQAQAQRERKHRKDPRLCETAIRATRKAGWLNSGWRQEGETVPCPVCGQEWVRVIEESEGAWWERRA